MSQEGVSDKWVHLVNTLWSLDKDNWKKRDPKRGKKILLSSNEIADVKRIYDEMFKECSDYPCPESITGKLEKYESLVFGVKRRNDILTSQKIIIDELLKSVQSDFTRRSRKMMRFLRLTKTGNRDLQNILTNNINFDSKGSFESSVLLFVKKHFPAKQKIVPDLIKQLWNNYQAIKSKEYEI